MPHRVVVRGVPTWIDAASLLGAPINRVSLRDDDDAIIDVSADVEESTAADIDVRLRGRAAAGRRLVVLIDPPLSRSAVRAASERAARDQRRKSPGFARSGTRVDDEGRWSLTPEALAMALANATPGERVIDACAGCGGNAIAFARTGKLVVAIDRDRTRLDHLAHNATVYGVRERIDIRHGDATTLVPRALDEGGGVLFIDPPWGRRSVKQSVGLADLEPLGPLWSAGAVAQVATIAKVPFALDPRLLQGGSARAWFGGSAGDAHHVKFVTILRDAR